MLSGGIQMVVEPIKYLIGDFFLLAREQAVIAQVSDSVEYSDRLTGRIVQVGGRKSQEHPESEIQHCWPDGRRISCGDPQPTHYPAFLN
jgi:hypothetical protein